MADIGFKARVQWRDSSGRFAEALDAGAKTSEKEASNLGARIAASLAPKRSDALAGSIHSTGHGFATGDLPEALPQEEGAAPHLIGTGFDDVLVNESEGFGPVLGPVLHPGNPAIHYMRNALKIVNGRLMGIIRANMP